MSSLLNPRIQRLVEGVEGKINVQTPAFNYGERIPDEYTCSGADVSPPIIFKEVPSNAISIVLIMYDPDAPFGVFYHWLIYDVDANIGELPENIPKQPVTPYGVQGVNDFGRTGYGGPCPPRGHGVHRYFFLALVLNKKLGIPPKSRLSTVLEKAKNNVIAYGHTMGVYSR